METLAERLTQFMEDNNISRSAMARKLGISQPAISHICNGDNNPSKQTVRAIAQAYGLSVEWLETGNGDMYGSTTRIDEISRITAQLFSETSTPYRFKIIKLISELDEKQIEELYNLLKKFSDL